MIGHSGIRAVGGAVKHHPEHDSNPWGRLDSNQRPPDYESGVVPWTFSILGSGASHIKATIT